MNLTITNHKPVNAEVQVKYNTYYGDNLSIKWDPSNAAQLQKISANEFRITQILKPDQKVTYKWT